jgi:hypothetical protein
MKKSRRFRSLKRSIAIATLTVGLTGSAAFAVLQSQNTLTGNTISTATANLQLSIDGTTYTTSKVGFDFNNIVPGGSAVPTTGYSFYLKNAGGTPLGIKFAVAGTPSNPNGVDLSKVNIILTTVASGTSPASYSLQSLLSANGGGVTILPASLAVGISQQYKLQVSMDADAVTGSSASLGNIDFVFTGTAQ